MTFVVPFGVRGHFAERLAAAHHCLERLIAAGEWDRASTQADRILELVRDARSRL